MVYKWKTGYSKNIKAQIAGEFIENLMDKYGGITPEIVLREAKKKRCPIHNCFEWDDKTAANEYRLEQARYILRQLVIVEEDMPEVRAFVHLEIEDSGQYITIQSAKEDPFLRDQLLQKGYQELLVWKKNYEEIQEFMGVVKAIKKVKAKKDVA